MEPQTYAQEFLSYVGSADAPDPTYVFRSRAVVRPDTPHLFTMVPLGWAVVWPDFIAFLSEASSATHDIGGMPQYSWWMDPNLPFIVLSLTDRIAGHVKERHTDLGELIDRALKSPASIFIPLDKLAGVEAGHRMSQGDWIRLDIDGSHVFLCEALGETGVLDFLTSPMIDWQEGLARQLSARVQENMRTGSLIEPPHISDPDLY